MNQRSSALLLSQNIERKARYSSPHGKATVWVGVGGALLGGTQEDGGNHEHCWILPQLLSVA